jgi:hypothetical protein
VADSSTPERKNGPGRPFPKGVSGNPGGKAKAVREAIEAFRHPADLKRLRLRLLELADSDDGRTAVAAIREYHDRALGKAPQAITGEDGGPVKVDAGLADMIARLGRSAT